LKYNSGQETAGEWTNGILTGPAKASDGAGEATPTAPVAGN
jgi:hypothetical protein